MVVLCVIRGPAAEVLLFRVVMGFVCGAEVVDGVKVVVLEVELHRELVLDSCCDVALLDEVGLLDFELEDSVLELVALVAGVLAPTLLDVSECEELLVVVDEEGAAVVEVMVSF